MAVTIYKRNMCNIPWWIHMEKHMKYSLITTYERKCVVFAMIHTRGVNDKLFLKPTYMEKIFVIFCENNI